jgi:hypothetical protein
MVRLLLINVVTAVLFVVRIQFCQSIDGVLTTRVAQPLADRVVHVQTSVLGRKGARLDVNNGRVEFRAFRHPALRVQDDLFAAACVPVHART